MRANINSAYARLAPEPNNILAACIPAHPVAYNNPAAGTFANLEPCKVCLPAKSKYLPVHGDSVKKPEIKPVFANVAREKIKVGLIFKNY